MCSLNVEKFIFQEKEFSESPSTISKEFTKFAYYIIKPQSATTDDAKSQGERSSFQEIEEKFQKCKTKFLALSIKIKKKKNYVSISICFEGNYFQFQLENINQECPFFLETKDIIIQLISKLENIDFLFCKPKESDLFKQFFPSLIKSTSLSKSRRALKNIKHEVSELKRNLISRCNIKKIKTPSISYRTVLLYLIRRFYYESNSFFDRSFFGRDIIPQKSWEEIINEIGIDCVDSLEEDEVDDYLTLFKEEFRDQKKSNIREFNKKDIIFLREMGSTNLSKIDFVFHVDSCKLMIQKTSNTIDIYKKEKQNYINLEYEHLHIMKCYGFDENSQSLLLEFMCNDTLLTLFKDQNLVFTEPMKYKIFFGLVFALKYFHGIKFIHRDLKPDNIFLDHDFNVFIGDFNVSKQNPQDKVSFELGSEFYSSPEIVQQDKYSYSADIYSFGIIIYEIFTGKKSEKKVTQENDLPNEYGVICDIFKSCMKEKKRISIEGIINMIKKCFDFESVLCKMYSLFSFQDLIENFLYLFFNNKHDLSYFSLDIALLFLMKEKNNCKLKNIENIIILIKIVIFCEQRNSPDNIIIPQLQVILGNIYRTEDDMEKAIYYFGQAAKLHNNEAQLILDIIDLQRNGKINPKNMEKIIDYLDLSAKQNNLESQKHLKNIYLNGIGTKRDVKKAIYYLELSANQKDLRSLIDIGIVYQKGAGAPRDIMKAIHYFELAAEENEPNAIIALGNIFLFGDGVKKDIEKAIYYFTLLADQNFQNAQYNLGYIYLKGEGVQKDINKALHYFELSANQGNSEALFKLGEIFMKGEGIPKDINKSIFYFELSAKQFNSKALYYLGDIYDKGIEVKKNIQLAINYYINSARQSNPAALFQLGYHYFLGIGVPIDKEKGFYYLKQSADLNDSYAQFFIGTFYFCKKTSDYMKKAIEYLERASNQNNSKAQCFLGNIYLKGDQTAKDIPKAIKYFKLSAKLNNSNAQSILGYIYFTGTDVEKDIAKVKKYFELSANQNNPDGQYHLGYIYQTGEGTNKDIQKAIHYFKLSANQNKALAQLRLGDIYYNGQEVQQDLTKAIHYYTLAANQNNVIAQRCLGYIFYKGDGVQRNMDKALKYYKLAAGQNNTEALNDLGLIYYIGDVVTKDMVKAIKYFDLSAQLNNKFAQEILGIIYQSEKNEFYNITESIRFLKLSAEQNSQSSQYSLGKIYKEGKGVPKNMKQAIYYFEQSAKQNNTDSQYELGNIYMNGDGVPNDIKKAIYYFELSAEQNDSRAQFALGEIYRRNASPENIIKSISFFQRAANNRIHDAQFFMGMYYHFHRVDKEKAVKLYCDSSSFNNFRATNNLGVFYIHMAEAEKSNVEKYKYLGRAIEFFQSASNAKDDCSAINLIMIYYYDAFGLRDYNKAVQLMNDFIFSKNKEHQIYDSPMIQYYLEQFEKQFSSSEKVITVPSKFKFNYYAYDVFKDCQIISYDLNNCDESFYQGYQEQTQ